MARSLTPLDRFAPSSIRLVRPDSAARDDDTAHDEEGGTHGSMTRPSRYSPVGTGRSILYFLRLYKQY
jgi:hypothetical protein